MSESERMNCIRDDMDSDSNRSSMRVSGIHSDLVEYKTPTPNLNTSESSIGDSVDRLNCSSASTGSRKKSLPPHKGTLHLRFGPMYSGKTTWLNGELTQLADKGFSVLKIIHSDDNRADVESCDDAGSTHNSSYRFLSKKIMCVRAAQLSTVDVSEVHVIGIDEGQFFPDLVKKAEQWVEEEGKHVRVAGLDGDFRRNKFGQVLDLIPIADEAVKLSASCKICLAELERTGFHGNLMTIVGPFTKRLGTSTEQKIVGGANLYLPVCRYHHARPGV